MRNNIHAKTNLPRALPVAALIGMVLCALFVRAATVESAEATSPALVALAPARIADTRPGQTTIDAAGPKGSIGAGRTVVVPVAGRGGVPTSGAGAVTLNVTVVGATESTHLTIWPTGSSRPTASSVNAWNPSPVANLVTVRLGADGSVSVFNAASNVHLVVDVAGYYPERAGFVSTAPMRVLDTRAGQATVDGGGVKGPLGPRGELTLPIAGRAGVPRTGVSAVVLNLTTDATTAVTHLTAYPSGTSRPTASNLNPSSPFPVANGVVVPLGTDGAIRIFNANGQAQVIVDLFGYFTTSGDFRSLSPARIADTRPGFDTVDGLGRKGLVGPGQTMQLRVHGRAGLPDSGVGAVVLNLTAVAATGPTFVTAWPAGAVRPLASNLNPAGPAAVPNLVVAKVGLDGTVSLFNNAGDVHLVVDLAGWIPGGGGPIDGGPVALSHDVVMPAMDAGETVRYRLRLPDATRFSIAVFPAPVGGTGLRCDLTARLLRADGSLADLVDLPCPDNGLRPSDLDAVFVGTDAWTIEIATGLRRAPSAGTMQLRTAATALLPLDTVTQTPALEPGQNALLSFTPTPGRPFVVRWQLRAAPGPDSCDVGLRLRRPDGSEVAYVRPTTTNSCFAGESIITPPTTSIGGIWSVELDNGGPTGRPSSEITVAQQAPPTSVNLPAQLTLSAIDGLIGRTWTFPGTSGRTVNLLGWVRVQPGPGCVKLELRRPNGTAALATSDCDATSSLRSWPGDRDLVLDATGTWTVAVIVDTPAKAASLSLHVSETVAGTVALDRLNAVPELTTGQDARLTVPLIAGGRITAALLTTIVRTDVRTCAPTLRVYRPDGTVALPGRPDAANATDCNMLGVDEVLELDATGTWTFVVDGQNGVVPAGATTLVLARHYDGGELRLGVDAALPPLLPLQSVSYRTWLRTGDLFTFGTRGTYGLRIDLFRPDGTGVPVTAQHPPIANQTGWWTMTVRNETGAPVDGYTAFARLGLSAGVMQPFVPLPAPPSDGKDLWVWDFDAVAGRHFTVGGVCCPDRFVLVAPDGRSWLLPASGFEHPFVPDIGGRWRILHTSDVGPGVTLALTFNPGRTIGLSMGQTVQTGTVRLGEVIRIESSGPVTGDLRFVPDGHQHRIWIAEWFAYDGSGPTTPTRTLGPVVGVDVDPTLLQILDTRFVAIIHPYVDAPGGYTVSLGPLTTRDG